MKVIVSRNTTARPPKGFGLARKCVIQAMNECNSYEDILIGDQIVLRICTWAKDQFTDLVAFEFDNEQGPRSVIFAVRLFADLVKTPVRDLSPKEIVSAFANRFGVEVEIAGKKSKCFLDHPFRGLGLDGVTPGANPPAHHYWLHLAGPNRTRTMKVAMAFCVDLKAYAEWVSAHETVFQES